MKLRLPKRVDVTLVDLSGEEPVILYRRLRWWKRLWRRLVRRG